MLSRMERLSLFLFFFVGLNLSLIVQAAIVPSGASLLEVTQNTDLDIAVTPQTGGGIETEFNAQMPFTKPSLGTSAGYYMSLTYETILSVAGFAWENTSIYDDLPRRTSEWSPRLSGTSDYIVRFTNFNPSLIYFEMLVSALPSFIVIATNETGGVYKDFFDMNYVNATTMRLTYWNNEAVDGVYLTLNSSRDTHYIAYSFISNVSTFYVDESVYSAPCPGFNLTSFVTDEVDVAGNGMASDNVRGRIGFHVWARYLSGTTIFAFDSNLKIPEFNYLAFTNSVNSTDEMGWYQRRFLSNAVRIPDVRYYVSSPETAGITYSRIPIQVSQFQRAWSLVVYPDLNTLNYFTYPANRFNLNQYNYAMVFAFVPRVDTSSNPQIGWINWTSGTGALSGTMARVVVNSSTEKVWVELYRHPLDLTDFVVVGPFEQFSIWESQNPIYLFVNVHGNADGTEAWFDTGVYCRGAMYWQHGTVEGTTMGKFTAYVYNMGFAGARMSAGFDYPTGHYISLPSTGTYRSWRYTGTLMATKTSNVNTTMIYGGIMWFDARAYIQATYGIIRSLAEKRANPGLPVSTMQEFYLAGGSRYEFSAENIDLRRITMSLTYNSSIPQNLSVLSDVRLSAEIMFFGGRQLEHIWLGNEQGILTYDSGEVAIAQVQNGQVSTGVLVVLHVEQIAYVDVTDPAIYNQAVTRGIADVTINYNVYATLIENIYNAGWIFDAALAMLAPLSLMILFPIIAHAAIKRRFMYGVGIMFAGIVFLISGITTTIVAGFVSFIGLLMTSILFKKEE